MSGGITSKCDVGILRTDTQCTNKVSAKCGNEFEIDPKKFEEMIKMLCYYCKMKDTKYLNGIDRLDNTIGYVENNIVPYCDIYNNLKNTLNESTFILKCAHIAHYNELGKYKLYAKLFNDYMDAEYRGKKLTENPVEYRKHNADVMAEYRENIPKNNK